MIQELTMVRELVRCAFCSRHYSILIDFLWSYSCLCISSRSFYFSFVIGLFVYFVYDFQ